MKNIRGFTLIEILVVIGILAILAAIAVPMYHGYLNRAAAVDLLVKHDTIRLDIAVAMDQGGVDKCDKLISQKIKDELKDEYAKLSIGFEAVKPAGYRPVLSICANAGVQGQRGIAVAKEAYKEFSKDMTVEKAVVLTDTVVSFAVPLTSSESSACRTAPSQPTALCNGGASAGAAVKPPAKPPVTPAATSPKLPSSGCNPGFEVYLVQGVLKCRHKCPAGQTRDALGVCQAPPAATPAPKPASARGPKPACGPGMVALHGVNSNNDPGWYCLPVCPKGQHRPDLDTWQCQ